MKKGSKKAAIIQEIVFLAAIVVLWQIIYVVGVDGLSIWKGYAMPSPAGVWESFLDLMEDGSLLTSIGYSLLRGAIG